MRAWLLIPILLINCLICDSLRAQEADYSWWNELHQWDGVTPWRDYMKLNPASLGPNALPVPEPGDGSIPDTAVFLFRTSWHSMKGDNTQDIFLKFFLPFAGGKVALELFYLPVEHYRTSIELRNERVSREYDPRGFSMGDFYFRTLVQLLRDHEKWPDISLGLACKTASGDNLEGARFTNAPAYYFDLTMGKEMARHWRVYGTAGFYAWQTYEVQYPQNDALLGILGVKYDDGGWIFQFEGAGYAGYHREGDRPFLIRAEFKRVWKSGRMVLGYRAGLNDYSYQTILAGWEFNLQ